MNSMHSTVCADITHANEVQQPVLQHNTTQANTTQTAGKHASCCICSEEAHGMTKSNSAGQVRHQS
jgi:hypothetical protein